MKKNASNTLMSRQEKETESSFDSATFEKNYPEKSYQSFNSTFTNTLGDDSTAEPFGYFGGIISPVEEDEGMTMVGPKEASILTFNKMVSSGSWSSIATYNLNLKSNNILKYSSNKSFGMYKDLRFSNFEKNYDLFYFDFSDVKKSDLPYCINNALASSRPCAVGFISGVDSGNLDQISKLGFLKSNSLSSESIFFIKKNNLNKISNVSIFDQGGSEKINFICDIAETLEEKIAGLQPYRELKYGSGLIFPYEKPQNVTYHMGSVSFPIDIIFVDSKDKIKKIASNIMPGTLGVFGSSDVSLVLEISGGASEILGINVGDKISTSKLNEDQYSSFSKKYKNFSNKQNIYVKTASFSKKISFENFDIFNHDKRSSSSTSIIKMASGISSEKDVCVYNFDEIILSPFTTFGSLNANKFASKNSTLANFLSINSFTPFEVRRAFFEIKKDLNENKKVIISTSLLENLDIIKSGIVKRASEELLFDSKIHSIEVISIPLAKESDIIDGLSDRYSSSILYKKVTFDKIAGIQISDDVKESASNALKILLESKKNLEKIVDSFKNNSDQYLKNKDKVDLIKKSEKSYNISCKKIAKEIVKMLLDIKQIIKIMNEIKDISMVDEKIESLSMACKEFVDTAEEIFSLESKIKEDNFVDQLSTETSRIEKSAEDLENNINNFSDYISKNILNKRILSR